MSRFTFVFSFLAILVSCGEPSDAVKKQSGEFSSLISADSQSESELQNAISDAEKDKLEREELAISQSTTLEFDKLKHDFGDVKQDSRNTTAFIVTNTGDKPLIIEDVAASCGCTTPRKPDGPIAPGESDVIEVTFKPKPGQENEIKKSVTVTANTEKKVHLLEIRAFVLK